VKLSSHCYGITGLYYITPWNVNSGFIVGNNKTLIIDAGSNYYSAQTIYGYASAVKPDNELILINTEKHLDHIGGNSYFSEKGINIYGHYLINRNQEELDEMVDETNTLISNPARNNNHEEIIAFQNTKIVNPNIKINRDMTIDLGKIKANIILTPGHTNTNLSIYELSDKTLYCGDLILQDIIPNLEEGDISDWHKWLNSINIVEKLDIEVIVPGHGEIIIGKRPINRTIKRIKEILNGAIINKKAPTSMN
jgi:glyoxylase-like metal-dependent hydrolase (beta-lactamase superfamily II)